MNITKNTDGSNNSDGTWCKEIVYQYEIAPSIVYGLCCVIGFVCTFFGYRIYRVSLASIGFMFVTFLVYITCEHHASHLPLGAIIAISVGLGVTAAVASTLVQPIGQFIVGSQIGVALAAIAFIVVDQFYKPPSLWIPLGVLAALGLIFGILAIKYQKHCLILGTGVFGSALMVGCLDYFVEKSSMVLYIFDVLRAVDGAAINCWYSWLVFSCWPITCIVGVVIQFRVTGYSYNHLIAVQEMHQRKVQKLNLQKMRSVAQQDRQQSHYRHLYQVRRVHGDVISQTFIKNVHEHQDKQKSYSPPPSTPTTLAPDIATCAESTHTTLSHVP